MKAFQASTEEDKQFALAFARLAQTYAALGFAPEAERHARTSLTLSEPLPQVEKFMIQANHARIMKKRAEAVGYYDKLATLLPGSDEVLSDLAAALDEKADYDRAFVEYTKLADRDKENLDALMGLGRVEVKRDKPQAALEHLNKALTIAIKRGNLEGQATAREWIGVAYRILNKSDLALSEFEQALKIARQIGRKRMIAEIVHEIGKVNANLGKFEASLKYYKESMALREEMKDQEGIGDTLIDFGNAYGNTGRLDQALTAFTDSLQIQRDQQNAVYEGLLLSNIGAIYTIRADHQAALTYYQQGLSVSEKLKNPGYTANVLYNIGETQFRLGRYAEAQERFLQAIKLRRDANNVRGEAEVRSSLAKLFGHQGRFDAAYTTAKEAYDAMQSTSEQSDWTVVISAEYGSALGHLGRMEEAAKVLEPAAVLAGKLEIWALLSDVRNYQGDLYARYGDLTRARSFYEQALQAATKVNDAARMSLSRLHLAITTAQEGRPVADLANRVAEADKWGYKPEAMSGSIALGASLVTSKQYPLAQRGLEAALANSERMGLLIQRAQSHYWLSQALAGAGDAGGARQQLQGAQRALDEIKREAQSDKSGAILKRADLAPIAAAK